MSAYGCHNSERKPGYLVRDGLVVETVRVGGEVVNRGGFKLKYHEDVASRECRYDFRSTDKECIGCSK